MPASQIDTPQPEPQKDTTMQDVVPPSAPRPSLPTAPISNVEQPRTASLPPAPNAQAKVPAMGQTSALYTPLPESIYENASATPGQPARAPPAVKVDQTLVNSIPTPPATQAMAPTQPPAPPLPSDPTAAAQPTVVIPTSNPAPVQ